MRHPGCRRVCIPAESKIPVKENPVEPFEYNGDTVNFIKEDGAGLGMLAPQEGTAAQIDGSNVVIHYVPKNTTVYNALYYGPITDTLSADVTFNSDGAAGLSR